MNKLISSIIVASCTTVAASAAWACPPMGKGKPCNHQFEAMDTNKDGKISKKEFAATYDQRFKELDTNKDGKLSEAEMDAAIPAMHGRGRGDTLISGRFEASDTNKDGALTKEEAKDMPMLSQNFDAIDANKDGKVTQEELAAMMEEHRAAGGPAAAGKTQDKK